MRKTGWNNLLELKQILDNIGVKFWLDAGVLLGYYREGKFIEWDSDIDIGILREDYTENIEKKFKENNWNIVKCEGPNNELEIKIKKNTMTIDIYFYHIVNNKFKAHVFSKLNNSNNASIREYEISRFQLKEIIWNNYKFNVPNDIEKTLIEYYGEDWKIPKKNYHWRKDPLFKPLKTNGKWIATNIFLNNVKKTLPIFLDICKKYNIKPCIIGESLLAIKNNSDFPEDSWSIYFAIDYNDYSENFYNELIKNLHLRENNGSKNNLEIHLKKFRVRIVLKFYNQKENGIYLDEIFIKNFELKEYYYNNFKMYIPNKIENFLNKTT